jgi:hypothetical protein
MALLDHLECF